MISSFSFPVFPLLRRTNQLRLQIVFSFSFFVQLLLWGQFCCKNSRKIKQNSHGLLGLVFGCWSNLIFDILYIYMHCHRQTIVRANSNKQWNRRTWSKLDVSAMPCTVGTIGGVRLRSTKPAQSKPYHGNWMRSRISIIEKKHKRVIIFQSYRVFMFFLYLCVRVHDRSERVVRNFTMFWETQNFHVISQCLGKPGISLFKDLQDNFLRSDAR